MCHAQGMWWPVSGSICSGYAKGNHLRLVLYRLRLEHFLEPSLGEDARDSYCNSLRKSKTGQGLLAIMGNRVVNR